MINTIGQEVKIRRQRLFSAPYIWLVALLVVAFIWRMQGVTQWPMPFHPMLQYENGLNVKYYLLHKQSEAISPQEKHWMQGYEGRVKGLPFVEGFTTTVCETWGIQCMWVSGVATCVLWIISACILFLIVQQLLRSRFAAFCSVCFFVLHPFPLVISRSFQHEAAQMLGYLLAWWLIVRLDFCSFSNKSILGAVLVGVLLCCKPGIGWIPLCSVHLAYAVRRHGWKTTLWSPSFYILPFIMLFPSLMWMKLLMPATETHQWKWHLLLTFDWYVLTWNNITSVVGWFPMLVTLIVTAWQISLRRWTGAILLAGFLAYAAVFNYATMTHDYYLLPLFPVVALAWGEFCLWLLPLVKMMYRDSSGHSLLGSPSLQEAWSLRQFMPYLAGAVATYLLLSPIGHYAALLTAPPYRPHEQLCRSLGQQLGMGTPIIALTNDYAMPLRYFSDLHAQWWPTQGDLWYEGLGGSKVPSATERLETMLSKKPRYFVVTLASELEQQPDLVELLQQYQEVPSTWPGARIFDLQPKR